MLRPVSTRKAQLCKARLGKAELDFVWQMRAKLSLILCNKAVLVDAAWAQAQAQAASTSTALLHKIKLSFALICHTKSSSALPSRALQSWAFLVDTGLSMTTFPC